MKKLSFATLILLTASAIIIIVHNAWAEETTYMSTGQGHVIFIKKTDISASQITQSETPLGNADSLSESPKTRNSFADYIHNIQTRPLYVSLIAGANKVKNHPVPSFEAALGAYLTDGLRTDLSLTHLTKHHDITTQHNAATTEHTKLFHRTQITTVMLNAYHNIAYVKPFIFYVGGGIGGNRLKQKVGGYFIHPEDDYYAEHTKPLNDIKTKKHNKFVWKISLGGEMSLADKIKALMQYNYYNLGSNKPRNIGEHHSVQKKNYNIHNISAGLRINL